MRPHTHGRPAVRDLRLVVVEKEKWKHWRRVKPSRVARPTKTTTTAGSARRFPFPGA
ncbi:hypothetical protein ZHAS_00009385 [Anopheles sinensis]|uniref:Uncharacterized protein n=1 Tax=Anopheles sinensis TaxID=74873 RepID=A0A084VUV8_ANOSI|nr:hypothetical protein ZHAS_00009385 [Anopheles sinensis]